MAPRFLRMTGKGMLLLALAAIAAALEAKGMHALPAGFFDGPH